MTDLPQPQQPKPASPETGNFVPETEQSFLKEQIANAPEKAREVVERHVAKDPTKVYAPGLLLSKSELGELEGRLSDPHYEEREEIVDYLLKIADAKGIINAFKVAERVDPSSLDEFHDRLIETRLL